LANSIVFIHNLVTGKTHKLRTLNDDDIKEITFLDNEVLKQMVNRIIKVYLFPSPSFINKFIFFISINGLKITDFLERIMKLKIFL
jgi:hypothetical protein